MRTLSRNTWIGIITIGLLVAFLGGTGFAQGWGAGHMSGYGMQGQGYGLMGHRFMNSDGPMMSRGWFGILNRLPAEYQLSEDQQTVIEKIYERHIKKMEPLQKKLSSEIIEYRNARRLSAPDDEAIQKHMRIVQDLRDQLVAERENVWTQIRQVLNDSQITYLNKHINRQKGNWCGQYDRGMMGNKMWHHGRHGGHGRMMWR
jgi:hypothetical protein